MIHAGNINDKIQEAKDTLFMAEQYMDSLGIEFEQLRRQKVTDAQVKEYIEMLLPMEKDATPIQSKNIIKLRIFPTYCHVTRSAESRKQCVPLYQCGVGFCNAQQPFEEDGKL